MKKQLLVPAAIVAALGVAGIGMAGVTHALDSSSSTKQDMFSSLAEAIAKKFNLNQSDVETVIKDQRSAMEQERENEIKDELTQLVSDSKLTQAQMDAIIAKRAELKQQRESSAPPENESASDRKATMEKRKTELDTWAKDNNIPTEYLRYVFGGPGHRGGPMSEPAPEQSS